MLNMPFWNDHNFKINLDKKYIYLLQINKIKFIYSVLMLHEASLINKDRHIWFFLDSALSPVKFCLADKSSVNVLLIKLNFSPKRIFRLNLYDIK